MCFVTSFNVAEEMILCFVWRKKTLSRAAFPNMNTDRIRLSFEEVKMKGMGSCDRSNVLIENRDGNKELLVGFVQLFSSKTATTLNSTVLLAFHLHTIFLNFFLKKPIDDK